MQCVLQYQVSCSAAGTLHRVKRSQLKIFGNPASRGVLWGTVPQSSSGKCRKREARLSHCWQTPWLSHRESRLRRHRPRHWRNPQATETWNYWQDGCDALLLEPAEAKSCQVYSMGRCQDVWSGQSPEDGTQRDASANQWWGQHALGARSSQRYWNWKLSISYLPQPASGCTSFWIKCYIAINAPQLARCSLAPQLLISGAVPAIL